MRFTATLAALFIAATLHAETIDVLIVDGQNNHNWKAMSPVHKRTLEATGRFKVAISTKGLPETWLHARDELYDSLRGPAKNFTLLATSYSEKSKLGEPMILTISFGKGRVFHTPMGHVNPTDSIRCVGFQTVMARGTEWAATGKVSIPVPPEFPTAEKSSVLDPEKVIWKK